MDIEESEPTRKPSVSEESTSEEQQNPQFPLEEKIVNDFRAATSGPQTVNGVREVVEILNIAHSAFEERVIETNRWYPAINHALENVAGLTLLSAWNHAAKALTRTVELHLQRWRVYLQVDHHFLKRIDDIQKCFDYLRLVQRRTEAFAALVKWIALYKDTEEEVMYGECRDELEFWLRMVVNRLFVTLLLQYHDLEVALNALGWVMKTGRQAVEYYGSRSTTSSTTPSKVTSDATSEASA